MSVFALNNNSKFYSMAPWRENNEISRNLEKVIIEDGVAGIGQYELYECPPLKEVTLPDSVTTIYNHAFYSCTALEKINIDKVTKI